MSEERAADGPNMALTERLMDALYQVYHAFLGAHPGEVSSATAMTGVIAAAANILITVHGQANLDEERLVSWDAYQDACIAELDWLLREPQGAGGAKT
jgi:hypothetical protein